MAILLYYSLIFLSFILTFKLSLQRKTLKNLPPCPSSLPIIGSLHHLNPPLHRSFQDLSQKYGHIFSLWFGSRHVVVISSPTLAQQCFTKHDIVLANRPRFLTGKHIFYNYTGLDSAPYGDHWRNLRRIMTVDVLSSQRLNSFSETRRDEILKLIRNLGRHTCEGFTRVELRAKLNEMIFNNMMRMVFGDDAERRQFKEIINEMVPFFGPDNKGDLMPLFRWFDLDGLVKRMKDVGKRADSILQGLLEEHRDGMQSEKTMLQHLLTLQKSRSEYYSDHIIKGLVQGMFLGGIDTTTSTIEWAMTALLRHQEIFKKAKDELDTHIGQDRLVNESDISNLPYLQNVINETLRLYSPAPILLPHFTSSECNIEGFTIPRDTTVLINAWAIHRDPENWSDAESFMPERFEKEGETDKLIAFGWGRRACPGIGLAHRTVSLTLGLLIQCFEWKQLSDGEIDMTEDKNGFGMSKMIPLEAMCKARPIIKQLINK